MTIQIDHLHKSYGSGAEAHEVLHDIKWPLQTQTHPNRIRE